MGVLDIVKPGVILGDDVTKLFDYAQKHGFAIPAVNCTTSSTINAVLECARNVKSPIIIQLSNGKPFNYRDSSITCCIELGGAAFFAGKGIDNKEQKASILGSIVAAKHVHTIAEHYGNNRHGTWNGKGNFVLLSKAFLLFFIPIIAQRSFFHG